MLIRETRPTNGRPPITFVECVEERCDVSGDSCPDDGEITVGNIWSPDKYPTLEIEHPPALLRKGILQPIYTFLLEEYVWIQATELAFFLKDHLPAVRVRWLWDRPDPDRPGWILGIEAWDWVSVEQIQSGKPLAGRILEHYSLALKDHDAQLLAKNPPSFVHSSDI